MTLEDIAAMKTSLIGTKEISEVTGCHRYAINVAAKAGKPIFGCTAFFSGNRVKVSRLNFLKAMGYERSA